MVTLAIREGSTFASFNKCVMHSSIPMLGFVVVGALCHARMPRLASEVLNGSSRTPSVFVPPTSTPTRRVASSLAGMIADLEGMRWLSS